METQISKWGNSFAVRIPMAIIQDLNIKEGDELDIEITDNKLILKRKHQILEDLLNLISKDNIHNEYYADLAVGKEKW